MKRKVHQSAGKLNRRAFLHKSTLSFLGLLGSSLPATSWAVRGNTLHIRNYMDVVSLDPVSSVSQAEGTIFHAIFRNLMRFKADAGWNPVFDAAEYFQQTDETHYDFRLKPGLMFSDGFGEMTADDVKFSFERTLDPAMNATNIADLGPLDKVEVHDRYSGTFILRSPYAAFSTIGLAGPAGAILSRKAVTGVGGRYSTKPPCTSGPYLFKSWQARRKTVLLRNPQWKGEEALFEEIHIYAMSDDKAAEMAFEAGQLDCSAISVETVDPFRRHMPPDSTLQVMPSARNSWLGMNQENPALSDLRIRTAIQYAIDMEAVVEAAWFGLTPVSTGPIPQGMIGHREMTLIPPRGDADKARDLLREAGVSLPLQLTIDIPGRVREFTSAQVIQWSLRKVGIEAEIRAHDPTTYSTLGREDLGDEWRNIQLFLQDFVGMADPYYSVTWFISQQMGLWNWERFSNEEFDRLSDLASASTDPSERKIMYHRMQDLMEESGCYRFISNGVMPQIYRNTITPGFRIDGYPLMRDFRISHETV